MTEDEPNPRVLGAPLASGVPGAGADVVGNDNDRATPHPLQDLIEEGWSPWDRTTGGGGPNEDPTRRDVEGREQIARAFAPVLELELDPCRAPWLERTSGVFAPERLDTWLCVEADTAMLAGGETYGLQILAVFLSNWGSSGLSK